MLQAESTLDIPILAIYPSQRGDKTFIANALWQGEEQEFLIRWFEDRVYFQPFGNANVYATLDACEETDALGCWSDALTQHRWGIYLLHSRDVFFRHQKLWHYFQFIFAPNGTGLVREWSSRDWIEFAPRETRFWTHFPETFSALVTWEDEDGDTEQPSSEAVKARHHSCHYALQSVRDDILFRTVSEQEKAALSRKTSVTKAEFQRAMEIFHQVGLWRRDTPDTSDEIRIALIPSELGRQKATLWTDVGWHGTGEKEDCFYDHFKGEGCQWTQSDWGKRKFRRLRVCEPNLRAFLMPVKTLWVALITNASAPSMHQQLEGQIRLRAWLDEKRPGETVEEWLPR